MDGGSTHPSPAGGALRALRLLLLAVAAIQAGIVVVAIARRVSFPFELEWMTGSVLDHVERVRTAKPLYAAPSADFIAYVYPPLYYWVCAPLGGSFLACRLVSVAALAVQGGLVFDLARKLGADRVWSAMGVLTLLACYPYVGTWYELERSDTLFVAMTLFATWLLVRRRGIAWSAAAGATIALAFYAKQPALLFLGALPVGMLVATGPRPWKDAVAFVAAGGVVLGAIAKALAAREGPWPWYYLMQMPRSHGVDARLFPEVASYDLPFGAVALAATLLALAWGARELGRKSLGRAEAIAIAGLAAGFVGALSSRLHVGGWINVLQQWTSFACVAIAVCASRVEAAFAEGSPRNQRFMLVPAIAVGAQLALWASLPLRRPSSELADAATRMQAIVDRLEARGEVLFVGRGHVTKSRHFQMSGLADVVRVDGHSPADLVRALETRRFAAILDDARGKSETKNDLWPAVMLEDIDDLRAPLLANYFVSERVDDETSAVPMRAPAVPRWIYLPRKEPLSARDAATLKARQEREMRLAEERARALRDGQPAVPPEDIERLAASDGALAP